MDQTQIPSIESPLDEQLDRIAMLVTAHGPKHLIRGMSALEANIAIADCIAKLVSRIAMLRDKVEKLRFQSNDFRGEVARKEKELGRLGNYLLVDWQDHVGRDESAVDVAMRLLKSYKEIKNAAC